MTRVAVDLVDVYPLRRMATGELEALLLQRGAGVRCPGTWEAVHGHLEPEERPLDAARCDYMRGRMLRDSDPVEAREALTSAAADAEQYGVHHLAELARGLIPA